jgi:hypothetical protein
VRSTRSRPRRRPSVLAVPDGSTPGQRYSRNDARSLVEGDHRGLPSEMPSDRDLVPAAWGAHLDSAVGPKLHQRDPRRRHRACRHAAPRLHPRDRSRSRPPSCPQKAGSGHHCLRGTCTCTSRPVAASPRQLSPVYDARLAKRAAPNAPLAVTSITANGSTPLRRTSRPRRAGLTTTCTVRSHRRRAVASRHITVAA